MSKSAKPVVAACAEQTSNFAGFVAMIYVEVFLPVLCGLVVFAYRTATVLLLEHLVVHLKRYSVVVFEIVRVSMRWISFSETLYIGSIFLRCESGSLRSVDAFFALVTSSGLHAFPKGKRRKGFAFAADCARKFRRQRLSLCSSPAIWSSGHGAVLAFCALHSNKRHYGCQA
jgi:hypothetical protein